MYRKLLELRHFEQRIYYLFLEGLIPGTIHLYTGQEAVAVGVCSNLREADFVSMHVCDFEAGVPPAIAVVGANVSIAAGMALSFKMKGTDQVVACFHGEGAVNQGMWHEGVNIASIWNLPVVFVCENNLYAASTHVSKVMSVKTVSERACAYGIPGVTVDGNDVIAVYSEARKAVGRARRGGGPTLIECLTYRHGGHSRGDPATYRPKQEVEEWLKKDPIPRFRERLLQMGVLRAKQAETIEKEVQVRIEEAVEFSKKSPLPEPQMGLDEIFA